MDLINELGYLGRLFLIFEKARKHDKYFLNNLDELSLDSGADLV